MLRTSPLTPWLVPPVGPLPRRYELIASWTRCAWRNGGSSRFDWRSLLSGRYLTCWLLVGPSQRRGFEGACVGGENKCFLLSKFFFAEQPCFS